MRYTAKQIADLLNAHIEGDGGMDISSVCTDSRTLGHPQGAMFVAIAGRNHNGHRFVNELYSRGVRCFMVEHTFAPNGPMPSATMLMVDSPLDALQQLAAEHRRTFAYPVIGITGSNGKTVVKEWLGQLLSGTHRVVRSPRSYNSQLGVPLAVLQMGPEFDLGIFEAGISQPGEMGRLARIIRPDMGILTNIGQPHQEHFDSLTHKTEEKLQLFASCKVLIYCADTSTVAQAIAHSPMLQHVAHMAWGAPSSGAQVELLQAHQHGTSTHISAQYQGQPIELDIPFADQASVENAMHCLCAMLYLGVSSTTIAQQMARLTPVAMRLELKNGVNGSAIINDSYNSDLGSLRIALDFMAQQPQPRRVLILSDIEQSGLAPEELYAEVAHLAAQRGVSKIIGIGPYISAHSHLFGMLKEFYPTTDELLKHLNRKQLHRTAVLIKGSRAFAFERITAALELKAHRTTLEVNLNAMAHNLNHYRSLLRPSVRTMAMVKAFAYGAGSVEVANLMQFQRVNYLGVAFADEGVELREAGITLPIIVMNPSFGTYDLIIEHGLEPEIYNLTGLHEFALALRRTNATLPYPVHIKLDTGMHRMGFAPDSIDALLSALGTHADQIGVASVFSHLAASDAPAHDGFTLQQIDLFRQGCDRMAQHLGHMPIRHILNSSGIERFPDAQLDMVRLGIGLHGISPTNGDKLLPVSTLKTRIIQIKTLQPGQTVGYGRCGRIDRASTIAVVPIGYADGLSRRLGNGAGRMLVNGQLAPTIGNICMDTCMIDITGIGAAENDEVTIFGPPALPVEAVAASMGTIAYELLTSVSRRVNRAYYQE